MGLLKTQSKIARLEADILDQFGEISEDQSEQLEVLQTQIEKDRDNAFRFLQTKRPKEIKEQIKDRIASLKKEIERMENIEGAIENSLYRFVEDKDYYEIKDDEGNTEFYVKPDMSVRRSVDPEKIEANLITHKLELIVSQEAVEDVKMLLGVEGYIDVKDTVVYPTVTELPEDHQAITKKLTPKVKFVKNKPKAK